MPWLKVDDAFTDHPKIEALSDRGFRLHVAGMCFCARLLTDGHIPADRVRRLLPSVTKRMLDELVTEGCWVKVEDGYRVHGYLDYNPSKEKVLHERAAAAARKAAFLKRKADAEARKNGAANAVPNGDGNASPTQPDPARRALGRGSGSQANPPSPQPSAGDGGEEGPRVVLESVKSAIAETRDALRAPKKTA